MSALFLKLLTAKGLPEPVAEHRFHPVRKWRFDFAWPEAKVALEVEGGVWITGRHTRGAGFLKDIDKYNQAALLGWRVFRITPSTLAAPGTFAMLAEAIEGASTSRGPANDDIGRLTAIQRKGA